MSELRERLIGEFYALGAEGGEGAEKHTETFLAGIGLALAHPEYAQALIRLLREDYPLYGNPHADSWLSTFPDRLPLAIESLP